MVDFDKRIRGQKKEIQLPNIEPLLNELKDKIAKKINSEIYNIPDSPLEIKKSGSLNGYFEILKKQVLEKKEKEEKEKILQKMPGISADFHGYPNIKKESADEMKIRKMNQRKYLKYKLEAQIKNKKKIEELQKGKEIEYEIKYNNNAQEALSNERYLNYLNKSKEAKILNHTWSQAIKLKKLKEVEEGIQRKGCNYSLLRQIIQNNINEKEIADEYLEKIIAKNKAQEEPQELVLNPAYKKIEDTYIENINDKINKIREKYIKANSITTKGSEIDRSCQVRHTSLTNLADRSISGLKKFPPYPKPLKKVKLRPLTRFLSFIQ